MCGILGIYSPNRAVDLALFNKSLDYIKHRGPDNQACLEINKHLAFGHTRLSIIDLGTTSNQPFVFEDRFFLIYNGEVFNYVEIRDELIALGHKFKTSGDTEVVLHSYIEWGRECVKKFNGMWAFAIYDKESDSIFCSRDRFGIKPFNYHYSKDEFIFSSEIKPIIHYKPSLRMPNFTSIQAYLYRGLGAQLEDTWFQDVKRLPPSHNLILDRNGLTIERYWDYPTNRSKHSFDEAKNNFKQLFFDSVYLRTRSDVGFASTLTAGLDSSCIVAALNQLTDQRITTYTAYSKNDSFSKEDTLCFNTKAGLNLDESIAVKAIKNDLNIDPQLIEVDFSSYLSQLREVIYYLESGHSSPAIVNIYQVYREVRKKYKVIFEGQGADELLGGYVMALIPSYLLNLLRQGKLLSFAKTLINYKNQYSLSYLLRSVLNAIEHPATTTLKQWALGLNVVSENFRGGTKQFKRNSYKVKDTVNRLLKFQHSSGLVNLLHYGDALSMANSLEARLPFMDYRLVEYIFTLPSEYKINNLCGKHLQRESLKDILPKNIYDSSLKIGFATPIDQLFRNSPEIEQLFKKPDPFGFFQNDEVIKLLNDYRAGKFKYPTILFKILSIKIWFELFFEKDLVASLGSSRSSFL